MDLLKTVFKPSFMTSNKNMKPQSTPTGSIRRANNPERHLDDNTTTTTNQISSSTCNQHEIDFVLVEGDAIRTSVEDDIVSMLASVGVKVNTRLLSKDEFNAAERIGDFHLSFSETWGAPYDPHAYASGWIAQDEGHYQALAGLEPPATREALFEDIEDVMKEENHSERVRKWEAIHEVVHDNAVMLPLWGSSIPTVLNNERLTGYRPGNQQFDYPAKDLEILRGGSTTVTIAPGAQTGLFRSVGRLDPHTYRPNEFFANNWVYEGLVSYGSYGQVNPALATSWTIEDSLEGDGGQRYTFQLRPNVKFHDGSPWDCPAAKLNFDHVLAEPLRSPDWHGWYGLVSQIKNWECNGEFELVVDTKDKYYPFLQELTFIRPLRMLSPAAFVGDGDPSTSNSCHVGWGTITSEENSDVVSVTCAGIANISGTGPFAFSSRSSVDLDDGSTVDDEVVFTANPDYWDGSPAIETLIVKRFESSEDVTAALLDGTLDLVWGGGVLPAEDLVALGENQTNRLSVFQSDDIQNAIVLLNSGKPPLDDINLRKTIIHAIDKKTIIDKELGGIFKPVDNVFPLDAPYCDVSLTPHWDYDLEKAMFLNCPQVQESGDATTTSNDDLAMKLGIGLGVSCFLLLIVAHSYYTRSKKLEVELENLVRKEEAVQA